MATPARLSAEERTLRARAAAYIQHSKCDVHQTTLKARAALRQKYLDQVDPDRLLDEAERDRRADAAMRGDLVRMSLASAKARRQRAQAALADELIARGQDAEVAR
jgi:hypothetical protein